MRPESIFHELDLNEISNDDALRQVSSVRAEVSRLSDIVGSG
jgi:hypothetical protein